MSDLQNQTPADTYKGLLQVGDYTDGITNNTGATALQVTDGAGVNTALALSTTRVGVGNNSPQAELDVSGGIEATTLTTSGAVTAGSIDVSGNVVADEYALDQTGTSSSAVAIHAPTTNELAIRTNSTEAMRIDSDGNVGIGTTDPALTTPSGHATAPMFGLKNSLSASISLFRDDTTIVVENPIGGMFFYGNGSTDPTSPISAQELASIECFADEAHNDTSHGSSLRFHTNNGATLTERMVIDKDGNVGIGTDGFPSAPLEVASTTGGVIMPRMTTADRNNISSPTNGEMIYNTDTNKFQGRANGAWVDFH